MSDAELVRRTLAGRSEAYEELVRRWAGRVTALCHAKIGCASAADDVAQESLLRAYRALRSLSEPDKFGAWLCRIATHACVNWLKSKQRGQVPFSTLGPEQQPADYLCAPEPDRERDEQIEEIKAAVAGLPDIYRQVVLLYYHQDVTYRDLADMLGITTATVNARLTRARVMLRERLTKCWR
jgi:RNA polymerase sigma-70 factor (ECF subfamily)